MLGRVQLWLLVGALIALLLLTAGRNGAVKERLRQSIRQIQKAKEMQDANARTSQRKRDVVDRLRDHEF